MTKNINITKEQATAVIILANDSPVIQDLISALISGKDILTAGYISKASAYSEYKITIPKLNELTKQGSLNPIKVGGRVFYRRQELQNLCK